MHTLGETSLFSTFSNSAGRGAKVARVCFPALRLLDPQTADFPLQRGAKKRKPKSAFTSFLFLSFLALLLYSFVLHGGFFESCTATETPVNVSQPLGYVARDAGAMVLADLVAAHALVRYGLRAPDVRHRSFFILENVALAFFSIAYFGFVLITYLTHEGRKYRAQEALDILASSYVAVNQFLVLAVTTAFSLLPRESHVAELLYSLTFTVYLGLTSFRALQLSRPTARVPRGVRPHAAVHIFL